MIWFGRDQHSGISRHAKKDNQQSALFHLKSGIDISLLTKKKFEQNTWYICDIVKLFYIQVIIKQIEDHIWNSMIANVIANNDGHDIKEHQSEVMNLYWQCWIGGWCWDSRQSCMWYCTCSLISCGLWVTSRAYILYRFIYDHGWCLIFVPLVLTMSKLIISTIIQWFQSGRILLVCTAIVIFFLPRSGWVD